MKVPIISQRLARLFQIMLEKNRPVSIGEFAVLLEVSRRTIFRELENVDSILKRYNLSLETSVKEGLFLKGSSADLKELAQMIEDSSQNSSTNKPERRKTLAFALLNSTEWQKLYYYASLLYVSEATVSLDLDIIQRDIAPFGLTLQRKKGVGVLVEGLESNIRAAMVSYMSQSDDNLQSFAAKYNFPPGAIENEVKNIMSYLSIQLEWVTADTIKLLEYCLCVQVTRVKNNCIVKEETNFPKSSVLWQIAQRIADEINLRFAIDLPDSEVQLIGTTLSAARAKQKNPISEEEETAAFNRVRSLAFSLIEKFDSRNALTLKTNEEFVRGLSVHLWSAIGRMKSGYVISDPLSEQIKQTYPDIYEKTKSACKLLQKEINREVPEGEIACLAAHFGAAVMQIGQEKIKRKLRVGIVCIGGIGVSYMLNSQVKKRFSSEVITEISEYNSRSQWEQNDFIISTIPLEASDMPIINVNHILTQKDYDNIRIAIDSFKASADRKNYLHSETFLSNIEKSAVFLKEVHSVLKNFKVINAADASTVEELAEFSGYRFGDSAQNGETIFNALMQREEISTQVIKELNLLLLHCTTSGVAKPVLALLTTNKKEISNKKGDTAKTCLAIIIPKTSTQQLKVSIGLISSALIEDEDFLSAILSENESEIYTRLEGILQGKLTDYFADVFKQ